MSNGAWKAVFTNPANSYVSLVSTPLYLYDFLLTFSDEVRYIWRRRLTGATVLYLVNRYAALLACTVNAFGLAKCHFVHDLHWWGKTSVDICRIEIRLVGACTALSYCAFAAFAALRIYALYGLQKWIFWIILVMGLVTPAIQILDMATYDIRRVYLAPGFSGCLRESKLDFLVPVTLMTPWRDPLLWQGIYMVLFEAILVMLTWYKTITNLGSRIGLARTPIMTLLRKDGTLYFILLFAATTLNVVGLLMPRRDTSPLDCTVTLVDT